MANTAKTVFLLTLLTVILVGAGELLGGTGGAAAALVFAALLNLGAYWFSDKIVLAQYGAHEIAPGEAPRVERIVDGLVARAGLPRPRIFVIPERQPNAFATGRNPQHAAVAVTEGLLDLMNDDELAGVLAHELSHVRHRDILIGSIAATIAGAVSFLATMAKWGAIFGGFGGDRDRDGGGVLGLLAMAIVAPIAALLVQLAVSRSREYAADAGAAELTGNPVGLARALRRLQTASQRVPMDASPATAHMFIVSPLCGRSFASLFSTHPSIDDRVRRLVGEMPL
ncbi:MAG: zinc metalloprotease HtpX [Candidatus Polarisedimenticolia bacterium]|nr:zinc metalloprotease HtpX [bacterium]